MKKKLYWQTVRVAEPCTEDWNEMRGNEQVRFCSHCAKSVNNISEMTRGRARRLVRKSGGNLCIRYTQHPETKAPTFTQIGRRRAPILAAGVVGASLSLASLTSAQGEAFPGRVVNVERKNTSDRNTREPSLGVAKIKGKVHLLAAEAPEALVSLLDKSGTKVRVARTNEVGEFTFDIEPGIYSLDARSSDGLAKGTRSNLQVKDGENLVNLDLAIESNKVISGMVMAVPLTSRNPLSLLNLVAGNPVDAARDKFARGEDVNQKEDDGSTPLFSAIENGNLELVRFLLDHGAKVNIRNDEKETPLMMIEKATPLEIVELLLQRGAKVDRVDEDGDTALIRAAHARVKPEVLKALINAGADLNIQNEDGMTALMTAADENSLENVRALLEAGADVNLRDAEGDNAWDYATDKEIEDLLVSYGVALDPEDLVDEHSDESFELRQPNDEP